MINQRAYPDIILGTGSSNQTIASYGCFECSLLHGLLLRGYTWSVASFDNYLTEKGAFTDNVLLSASKISDTLPEILEGRNEQWDDSKVIAYLKDKDNYVVLGEVSGKGIGGSGQHFVYMDYVDVSEGKITMTYVDDPWDGLENQKVTTRYNSYGNILSLRVFKIVKKGSTDMANTITIDTPTWEKVRANSESYDLVTDILKLDRNSPKAVTEMALEDLLDLEIDHKQEIEDLTKIKNLVVELFDKNDIDGEQTWDLAFKQLQDHIDFLSKPIEGVTTTTEPTTPIVPSDYIDLTGEKLSSLVSAVLKKLTAGDWS